MIEVLLSYSERKDKKYKAVIYVDDVKIKTVHFGAMGYDDYTTHHDPDRKDKYIARHRKMAERRQPARGLEDWTVNGITTAGFWSRWLLWNLPSLEDSIHDTERRFGIEIVPI